METRLQTTAVSGKTNGGYIVLLSSNSRNRESLKADSWHKFT